MNTENRYVSLDTFPLYTRADFPQVCMSACISKAINNKKTPVKEKHIRNAIIVTHQHGGSTSFMDYALLMPIRQDPIICWKFVHVLHKILREGHSNVQRDCEAFAYKLADIGTEHIESKSKYAGMVKAYCNLVSTKLQFHELNRMFPGNLEVTLEELLPCLDKKEHALYQLCYDVFDYIDGILELQDEIFKCVRNPNSKVINEHWKLCPVIPCMQESMLLYDFIKDLLVYCHERFPHTRLEGCRRRFQFTFGGLQLFINRTRSLKHSKDLIKIKDLPKDPPNFVPAARNVLGGSNPLSELLNLGHPNELTISSSSNPTTSTVAGAIGAMGEDAYMRCVAEELAKVKRTMDMLTAETEYMFTSLVQLQI